MIGNKVNPLDEKIRCNFCKYDVIMTFMDHILGCRPPWQETSDHLEHRYVGEKKLGPHVPVFPIDSSYFNVKR